MTRPKTAFLLVGALALLATGCGGDGGGSSMKVTGNCGLGSNTLAVEQVLPTSVLEKLIGDGDYRAVGGVIVRDGKLPAAYDGDCALEDSSGQDALRLGLVHKGDPRYTQAQQALASGDQTGFVKVDDTTYAFSDSSGGGASRAVAVLPDRLVILQVLQPADGADVKQVGTEMKTVVDRVKALS